MSQDSLQKILKELLQETKHKNTPQYDFTNEEKPSERFDDCRVQIVSQASLQRILQKLLQEIKKKTPQYDFTSEEKPGKRFDDCGFSFFFKDRVRVSSIRELMQLARHLKTDLLFYFDYSPLQVITNISSHITQPVKRFSHYVMMCLFGQLHIREKSILTYVFLKESMSSVKSCGLVYFVKCKLQVLFAIELKKLL